MKKALFSLFLFASMMHTAISQPTNDDCSGAIVLTDLNDWCSADGAYTNVAATASISNQPTCWTGTNPNNDVWFKFTATASAVNIKIDGTTGTAPRLNKPQISLMESDGTCTLANMTQMGCTEFPASNTYYASLYVSGLFIGTEYYILVDGNNSNVGKFKLCINNFEPPTAPGQDCATASMLCSKNTFTQQKLVGLGTNEIQSAGTCLTSEHNSVWYKWVAKDAGTITFSIDPLIPNDDLDWVLYEIPAGGCASRIVLSCNGSSCNGPTGLNLTSTSTSINGGCNSATDLFNMKLTQVTGKTYALFIDNFTSASTGLNNGFTLSFGGTGNFVGPESFFTIAPSAPYCTGANITLTSTALGNPTIHHWDFGAEASIDSSLTAGPHTISYSTPGTKTIVYTVGNGTCTDVSFQTITVTDCCIAPVITAQPISVNQCPGTAASLSVTATGTALTYQWRKNNVNISGAVNSTYPIAAISASDTGSYTCVVYSNLTCSDTTNIATVTMVSPSPVGITIAAVPNIPICDGTSVTFTATPTNGGISPAYVWKKNGTPISGQTGSTYTTTGLANNDIITCQLTSNLTCVTGNPATSAGITVQVNPILPVSVTIAANPGNTICNGSSVTFTASPTNGGTTPQYQWLKNGLPISGEMNPTYTSTTLANNDIISCVLNSNAICPSGNPDTSNVITMIASSLPVSITISAQPNGTICYGENVTLTAVGVNPGLSPTYQWKINGVNTGTNSTTLVTNTLNQGDSVQCILTSSEQCATGSPANSSKIIFNVSPTTVAGTVSPDSTLCSGGDAGIITLSGNTGSIVGWEYSTNNGSSWGILIGAGVNPSFPLGIMSSNGTFIYHALVKSGVCPVQISSPATVVVKPFPVLSVAPLNPAICYNGSLQLTASGATTYSWSPDSTLSANTGTMVSATPHNNCTYTLKGDLNGCVDSIQVPFLVNPLPTISITPTPPSGCVPLSVNFTANSAPAAQAYAWNFGNAQTSTSANPTTTYNYPGQYTVSATITDVNGCTSSITEPNLITASPIPAVNFTISPEVGYANKEITFNSSYSGSSTSLWKWNFGDGSADATEQVPMVTHTYTHTEVFSVTHTVINEFGCTNSVTKPYTVIIDIIIPNIFTPNQDGSNDTFKIEGVQFMENASLKVYNRWGGMVYKADSYKNDWDGGNLADGVYFYVLTLPDYIGAGPFNGTVTILH